MIKIQILMIVNLKAGSISGLVWWARSPVGRQWSTHPAIKRPNSLLPISAHHQVQDQYIQRFLISNFRINNLNFSYLTSNCLYQTGGMSRVTFYRQSTIRNAPWLRTQVYHK